MDTDNRPSLTREEAQDLKNDLFERAKVGEITGEEADAEAMRLGLGRLSGQPGPNAYRPEAETHWTLPMAVAWIAYLDLDDVREWSAPYRAECFHWLWQRWQRGFEGPVYEGWHLEQRSRPTFSQLGLASAFERAEGGKPMSMSITEAQKALWVGLREGFFAASGVDFETGRRVEIPALDWHELVPVQGHGEVDEVRRGLLGTGYRDVLIPSVALRGFWHPTEVQVVALPDLMPPTGLGYLPLFCVAQWIATEGGVRDFDPMDVAVWRGAYGDLLAAIASDKVRVVGIKGGQPEPVPSHLFAGIEVDYPYFDASIELIMSHDVILRCHPYIDDEHWRKGFDDALVDRARDHWKRLMAEKGDVRSLWPFEHGLDVVPDQRTGMPGRPPKSKHLIDDELARRAVSGELAPTLAREASALLLWLIETHKSMARPTVETIENNIRATYRALKSTK
jgi:hypothetical protein